VKNRRSMVHITDVVEAAVLAAFHPVANGQCYIVTDGRPYSTREIYEMICRALGRRVPSWSVPPPVLKSLARVGDFLGSVRGRRFPFDSDALEKLTGSALYSMAKISRELGYRPRVTLEDALPEMISRYRQAAS
jgi:UDP-glucose 4-epimerase